MKKIIKSIFTIVIVSAMVCSMTATAFAQECGNETKQAITIIGKTTSQIPNNVIQELLKDYPGAGQITITGFETGEVHKSNISNQPKASSSGFSYTDIVKNQTQSGILAQTDFVTSFAKGQSGALGESWSSAFSSNTTGGIDSDSLGIIGSITAAYPLTQSFSGPPENNMYNDNSRIYYVKFYENKGTYTAICHDSYLGTSIAYAISGTYTEPAYYVSYYVDQVVK